MKEEEDSLAAHPLETGSSALQSVTMKDLIAFQFRT